MATMNRLCLQKRVCSSLDTLLLPQCTRSLSTTPSFAFASTKQPVKKVNAKGKGTTSARKATAKPKKKPLNYKQFDLGRVDQYSLCDAMRYIRAFEVGRPPSIPKYECHVKLKTRRDGAVIRNQIRLPHAVKTGTKICVICPPDSPAAKAAREAGAILVGEDEVFEIIKSGKFDFERCVAHPDSLDKMGKAGIPRILGPRGLMPNTKMGTLVENIGGTVRSMLVGSMYRERQGKLSMAIGQLSFTPEHLKENIQVFLTQIKRDAGDLSDVISKEIDEVVLSSTNSPGFSLNGQFRNDDSLPTAMLSGS